MPGKHTDSSSDEQIQEALKHIDINSIQIDGNTVRYLDSELSLDLGAIAKGYTAQLAKEALNKAGLTNGYINAGGNVVLLGEKKMDPIGRLVFKVQIQMML